MSIQWIVTVTGLVYALIGLFKGEPDRFFFGDGVIMGVWAVEFVKWLRGD